MYRYYSFLLCLLIISCKEKIERTSDFELDFKITKTDNLLAQSIEYICLDGGADAIFGNIDNLIYRDSLFYLLDANGRKKIFCFDRKGGFKQSYGNIGKGVGEYLKIKDFDVYDSNVYIYSRHSKKILIYDECNMLVDEVSMDFRADAFKVLDENRFLFIPDNTRATKNALVVVVDQEMNIIFDYGNYSRSDQNNLHSYSLIRTNRGGYTLLFPFKDFILNLSSDLKSIEKIGFDFGNEKIHQSKSGDASKILDNNWSFFLEAPIVFSDNIYGLIYRYNKKHAFRHTKNQNYSKVISTMDYSHFQLFPYHGAIDEKHFISSLDIELYNLSIDKDKVPLNVVKHLKNGGTVLLIKTIK